MFAGVLPRSVARRGDDRAESGNPSGLSVPEALIHPNETDTFDGGSRRFPPAATKCSASVPSPKTELGSRTSQPKGCKPVSEEKERGGGRLGELATTAKSVRREESWERERENRSSGHWLSRQQQRP